jgi:hypothetical protein
VRQQRRSAIEEQATIDHDSSVVAVRRKRRTAPEERELYAMVTA